MTGVGDENRMSVESCAAESVSDESVSVDSIESAYSGKASWLSATLILLVACVLLGWYCCELNRRLYTHHQPFFDSLSYNEKLFRVMTISRESGFIESLETACFSNNTNCLPFLVAAVIGPIVSPSRMVGVWIQTGLFYLFLLSLFYFLVRIKQVRARSALAGCFVFFGAKCLFLFNGGLSDFRMDLSLYLGFAMTSAWYLTSMAKPTKRHFFLLGIAASICCLFRATAPIYLLFALGPVCLFDLFSKQKRKEKLVGLALAIATVVLFAGWFFVLNIDFLKYYYVDWNTDANAKIPLYDAFHHLSLTRRCVGEPLILMIFCWVAATFWHTFRSGKPVISGARSKVCDWLIPAIRSQEIDWRIAWIGLAPVVMMIARRAGLNPFVTMPCVFGLILFFTLPVLKQLDRLNIRSLTMFCWAIMIVCVGMAGARAWKRHSPDGFDTMTMNNQLIDTMLEDTRERQEKIFTYGVMHLTDLNTSSLYSTLLFDRVDGVPEIDGVTIGGIKIKRIPSFSRPAAADWRNLTGDTDEEKVAGLIEDANSLMDFVILPDKETAKLLVTEAAHNYINRFLVSLREQIANDEDWIKIGSSIRTNESEVVEIYRKIRD